jgi:DNA-binding response OmpR family regulator
VEPRHIYATVLARHLDAGDFAVEVTNSGNDALAVLRDVDPDVVVVCVGSHDYGLAMLDRLRKAARADVIALEDAAITPLLSVTGPAHKENIDVLGRRIRHALRRYDSAEGAAAGLAGRTAQRREVGDLVIDMAARRVYRRGIVVALTRLEFAVLAALSECPGELLTCGHLQAIVWGTSHPGGRSALGVHVSKLRRKLGDDPASPRYVRTVRGIGYCLLG